MANEQILIFLWWNLLFHQQTSLTIIARNFLTSKSIIEVLFFKDCFHFPLDGDGYISAIIEFSFFFFLSIRISQVFFVSWKPVLFFLQVWKIKKIAGMYYLSIVPSSFKVLFFKLIVQKLECVENIEIILIACSQSPIFFDKNHILRVSLQFRH